jgi:23S rRNA (cytosine1962-C5)-methyltransferase
LTASLTLKPGREKSLLRRHPWIFSGAIARIEGSPASGETVLLRDSGGRFLAWAAFSPHSQIAARVWSFDEDERIEAEFFRMRLQRAILVRGALVPDGVTRLVHAESDGLPGITVDRYADTSVMQLASAGAEAWRQAIVDSVVELTGAVRVIERSDVEARKLEGLASRIAIAYGPPRNETVRIVEHGLVFEVDVERGHKTGFYLDQRDNRRIFRELADGREVLDCFCYTGGFAINAVAGGARSVVGVDSSCSALELAQKNLEASGLAGVEWVENDVFQQLRTFRDQARSFDLIVLDPPKFAPAARLTVSGGRAYKDINLLAFKLLRPGGLLATFSCSGAISPALFQKIASDAALDAEVEAQVVGHFHAAPDHPVALHFPEGEYLKGLLCRIY